MSLDIGNIVTLGDAEDHSLHIITDCKTNDYGETFNLDGGSYTYSSRSLMFVAKDLEDLKRVSNKPLKPKKKNKLKKRVKELEKEKEKVREFTFSIADMFDELDKRVKYLEDCVDNLKGVVNEK